MRPHHVLAGEEDEIQTAAEQELGEEADPRDPPGRDDEHQRTGQPVQRYGITTNDLAPPTRHHDIGYRTATAVADLEAQAGGHTAAKVAEAVRYLEPALVPAAAAVWLYNLMLLVR